jgi:hypothetical protein
MDSQADWVNDLFRIYDNQRPYYPAPVGLEIGDLVLTAAEIRQGIERAAQVLASESGPGPLAIIGKLESGRTVATELSAKLKELGKQHQLLLVKTRWLGHGRAAIVAPPIVDLSTYQAVVCDTMISSGITFYALENWIRDCGCAHPVCCFTLINFNRRRHFSPTRSLSVKHIHCHDWTIGYNSDGLVQGETKGRNIPFIVSLKPTGRGNLERLWNGLKI